jgi:hypothetical protein
MRTHLLFIDNVYRAREYVGNSMSKQVSFSLLDIYNWTLFSDNEIMTYWRWKTSIEKSFSNDICLLLENDSSSSVSTVQVRKVPKSLEEIVRTTKFSKAEIRLLYKGFKQVWTVNNCVFIVIFNHNLTLIGMSEWCRHWTRISNDLWTFLSSWQLSYLYKFSISSVGSTKTAVFYIWSNVLPRKWEHLLMGRVRE